MSDPKVRRHKGWWQKVRDVVWPRMGYRRYFSYLQKKVLRLSASPHAVAAGVASGAAVSVFPFIGLHFFLGFVLAWITRGNMLAAAIGTAWGNPITFPIFFSLSYQFGSAIRGLFETASADLGTMDAQSSEALSSGLFSINIGQILPTVTTMVIGAIPLSIFTWVFFYFIVRGVVSSFQLARKARFARKKAAAAQNANPPVGRSSHTASGHP